MTLKVDTFADLYDEDLLRVHEDLGEVRRLLKVTRGMLNISEWAAEAEDFINNKVEPWRWTIETELRARKSFVGEGPVHRFRPCQKCGGSPDIHNANRGAEFVGHEYA